jgi:hypothetical protein
MREEISKFMEYMHASIEARVIIGPKKLFFHPAQMKRIRPLCLILQLRVIVGV